MPYSNNNDLPDHIKTKLPSEAQTLWRTVFNETYDKSGESKAFAIAWTALRNAGWVKDEDGNWEKVKKSWEIPITKIDEDKHLVFGWASVAKDWSKTPEGVFELKTIIDCQNDVIESNALEEMGYKFAKNYREGGEMHIKGNSATMVESMVFTLEKQKALGIPEGIVPLGWWIGFEVTDEDAWQAIKSGVYKAFSIEGTVVRETVSEV